MQVMINIAPHIAEVLEESGVEGVSANTLTYNPAGIADLLANVPEGDARQALTAQFADIAAQLNIQHVMFKTVQEPVAAPVETEAFHPDEHVS